MPLYFGSDNKIYNSDLDGSTAYAGNTSNYIPISFYDHKNILKFYSKNNNQNIFFDNSTTFGFSISRKDYVLDKNEKISHFTNLVNNYINRNISLLNYNLYTIETYLNSDVRGLTSDAIAIISWKNNLENKRDQVINNFVNGITNGLPSLKDFIEANGASSFSSLRFYRGGNFSRPSNRSDENVEIMRAVINEGSTGGGGDGCTCQLPFLQSITPEVDMTYDSIFGSYNYCVPPNYSFPDTFIEDSKNLSQTNFGIKYFNGGTSGNLGCPIFRMIKNESGITSEVYLALTPNNYLKQSEGIDPLEHAVNGGNLLDFYEQVRGKSGFGLSGCGGFDDSLSGNLYDPVTNPCGVVSWKCLCEFFTEAEGNISRKLYDDSANERLEPCEPPEVNPRFPLPGKPVRPSLQTGNDLRLGHPPRLLWQDDEYLEGTYVDQNFEKWVSPNYSGALTRCRQSGTPESGDPYWHGLSGAYRLCNDCAKEPACLHMWGDTKFSTLVYEGTVCRTRNEPYNIEFPNNPTQYIECLDYKFTFNGTMRSFCSLETSCECGCDPECCMCVCAGNHEEGSLPPDTPTCTGGTCDYDTRVVDVVNPPFPDTGVGRILDDAI